MKINNRRYIGCKTKLLKFIYDTAVEFGANPKYTLADVFAGTGAVGNYFAEQGYKVIFNDTLYSNVLAYKAWHGTEIIDFKKVNELIEKFNNIDAIGLEDNYFSAVYGEKYFSTDDAKKIGYIRDYIEEIQHTLNDREYAYLVTSLMYTTDRIANTCGHFESFLSKKPETQGVVLSELDIESYKVPAEIYNMDANELVRNISCDIAYLDPPYNARQYINFYHVLENLARWNKPTIFEGNSMKFKRTELKSDYCRNKAPQLMEDLIMNLDCKLIIVSYNNTYKAKSSSSINTISAEQIVEMLSKRGKVTVKEQAYKAFNSGKTDLKGHKELLYICEVSQ